MGPRLGECGMDRAALPVQRLEEAVQVVVAMGPGMGPLQNGSRYRLGSALGDAHCLIICQLGRRFPREDNLTILGFEEHFQAGESLRLGAGRLIDEKLGGPDYLFQVIVARTPAAPLPQLTPGVPVVSQVHSVFIGCAKSACAGCPLERHRCFRGRCFRGRFPNPRGRFQP